MRLFISVDLDTPDQLTAAQQPFADADGLRLTDPEQAHITLKFLGEVPESRIPTISEAVREAVNKSGVPPFSLELGGLGVFPDPSYVRVIWLGVTRGKTELTRLHEAIERELTACGFDPEEHEFTPHVTLARMEHAASKTLVQEALEREHPTVTPQQVSAVSLTESILTTAGPEYRTIERVSLSGDKTSKG